MLLYGTIESERASKGQGGNNSLEFSLNVGSTQDSREVVRIRAKVYKNESTGEEEYAVYGTWHGATESEKLLHTGTIKAKRQKGECKNGCAYHSQNEECTDIPS